MEINLSSESVEVIMNALRCSRNDLKRQIRKHERSEKVDENKLTICKAQLNDVEWVLSIFEEAEAE